MLNVDRRLFVTTALGGAAALALAPSHLLAAALAKPPLARAAPVSETLFGTTLVDDYRWMEDSKSPELLAYLKAQDGYTRSVLASLPGREALLKRIQSLSGETVATTNVRPAGGKVFFQQRPTGSNDFKLYVREGGVTRLLLDPSLEKGADGAHVSINWWLPSPDGRLVVVGTSSAGSEAAVARIIEVATVRTLPARIEKTDFGVSAWLPDSSGFFYNQLAGTRGTIDIYKRSMAKLHRVGSDPATDLLIAQRGRAGGVEIAEDEGPTIIAERGSDAAGLLIFDGVRNEIRLYTAPLADVVAGAPKWTEAVTPADAVTRAKLAGKDLYLLSNKGADNGRILVTDALRPDPGRAREVMATGKLVAEDINAARDGVYVTMMDGGIQRLRRIGRDGRISDIGLPYEGSVGGVWTSADEDGAYVDLSGSVNPIEIWRVDASGRLTDTGLAPKPPIDLAPYESFSLFATAKDGTKIPVFVVKRRDTPRDGSAPCLVDAYGSYQIPSSPYFSPRRVAFLDAGGVLATAGVRGGGEYGRAWHAAGRQANKPNTWRDLIACCEELIRQKITSSPKLAIQGGSAGGITVGRAMTERPDLFAAVVSNVGANNMVRMELTPNGPGNIPEFGSVKTEAGFRALLAMDSTQAVRKGTRYPAVLLTTGATDPRVEPWQIAKMAAKLQAAQGGDNPILLRVDFDAGHGIGSTRAQRDLETADTYAFILWRTGAPGFQPRS